jgi:hypothetical protein
MKSGSGSKQRGSLKGTSRRNIEAVPKYGYRVDFDGMVCRLKVTRFEIVGTSAKSVMYRDGLYEKEMRSKVAALDHQWFFSFEEAKVFALERIKEYKRRIKERKSLLDKEADNLKNGIVWWSDTIKWKPGTKVIV